MIRGAKVSRRPSHAPSALMALGVGVLVAVGCGSGSSGTGTGRTNGNAGVSGGIGGTGRAVLTGHSNAASSSLK